jgi:inositol oxygenase
MNHYKLMRSFQTVEFYDKMMSKYCFDVPRALMTIREAFVALENYVDSSDPDVDIPNIVHMFQTAEGIRKAGHPDWMQLVGLVHDMGKIMYLWGTDEDGQNGTATGAQWALGGDTWVLGARIPDCTVLPQFNQLNPDMADDRYNTELGIYQPNCGLSSLKFAYGHDEYLYHMMVANKALIPPEGLAMIRFHSLYPWHTGGAYRQFMNDHDKEMLEWSVVTFLFTSFFSLRSSPPPPRRVLEFNKYDLYTKDRAGIKTEDIPALWEYYTSLMVKYNLAGQLKW